MGEFEAWFRRAWEARKAGTVLHVTIEERYDILMMKLPPGYERAVELWPDGNLSLFGVPVFPSSVPRGRPQNSERPSIP